MEQIIDKKAVDQFFDAPAAGEASAGFGESMAGEFPGDTSKTEYYTPSRSPEPTPPEPTPTPGPDAAPTDPDQAPQPFEPAPDLTPKKDVDYVSENLSLKQKIAELELYKPLGDMIQRNPNFLTAVEQSLKSMPAAADAMPPKIERPTPPVKPAQYDPAEAMSVPGSESWKFREATESFNQEMFSYYEKRDLQREEIQTRAVESYQAQQAQMQAQQQLSHELSTRYGYTPDRVEDFIKTMSDPSSRSIENLVALHNMQLQKRTQGPHVQKQMQKNVPLPAGVTGGGGAGQTKQLTESDSFNLGLMSARR